MSFKLSPHGGSGPAPSLSEVDHLEGPFETNAPEWMRGLIARLFTRPQRHIDVEPQLHFGHF